MEPGSHGPGCNRVQTLITTLLFMPSYFPVCIGGSPDKRGTRTQTTKARTSKHPQPHLPRPGGGGSPICPIAHGCAQAYLGTDDPSEIFPKRRAVAGRG